MVASYLIPFSAPLSRTLHDVYTRAVVPLHVEIARRESGRLTAVEIARNRQGFEKNLGHYHRASQIQHDAAVVQRRERRGQSAKIAVTGVPDRGATRRRVLMNDLGAERGVNGAGNSESVRG